MHAASAYRSEGKDLHMEERCPFFEILRIVICSEVIGADQLSKPIFKRKACCMHPRSKHRTDTISSSATCGGYMEKCDVKSLRGGNLGKKGKKSGSRRDSC
jgi:hypothetical protein